MTYYQSHFANPVSPVETVPGTLRGFRWMKLEAGARELTSVSMHYRWLPGENISRCPIKTYILEAIVELETESCSFCAKKHLGTQISLPVDRSTYHINYFCTCRRQYEYSPFSFPEKTRWSYPSYPPDRIEHTAEFFVVPVGEHHNTSPDRNCECGFYASYLPMKPEETPGLRHRFNTQYAFGMDPILAVVQSYGKIVLGELGFRAEKMQVEALFALNQLAFDRLKMLGWDHVYYGPMQADLFYEPDDVSELIGEKSAATNPAET